MAKKSKKQLKRPEDGQEINKPRNFVHLYGVSFNKSAIHEDKRKAQKSGKRKHKTAWVNSKDPGGFSFLVSMFCGILQFK